jgi:1,4-alpha-glucan branching enzyme
MLNVILGPLLASNGLGDGGVANVKAFVDETQGTTGTGIVNIALDRVFGVFALIMTSVGMPMFLAGEEFGDVHDTDYNAVDPKQQDPVQWQRAAFPGNAALQTRVGDLIQLRTANPALQRNEIAFFYFHPAFDTNDGPWVFAYARTNGVALGSTGQVIVIANVCGQAFPSFAFPAWPWIAQALTEVGFGSGTSSYDPPSNTFTLSLDAFQVRAFTV